MAKKGSMKNRAKRILTRNLLRASHGDRCIWCGGFMEFPIIGLPIKNRSLMATIEHFRAKQKGMGHNIVFLDLCHNKCNK